MKLTQNDIFLFQGDSITDGNRGRTPDPNHILGHGFACMVSSKLGADNFTEQPTFINRGQSGDTITKMYARWREDAILLKPTYINLLIGINDTCMCLPFDNAGNGTPGDYYERILRLIITDTLKELPDVKFILCEPFFLPLPTQDAEKKAKYERVSREITEYQKVVRRVAAEYNFTFVPFQDLFDDLATKTNPEYLVWDCIHPTMVGHEFMTRRWLEIVG